MSETPELAALLAEPEKTKRSGSLLGRIAHHLKTQNWTAIIIELLVVVFGVFLGFQLTAWNTDLANQRREVGILREIAADLRQDRAELATGREVSLRRAAAAHYVIEKATGRAIDHLNAQTASSASVEMRAGMPLPQLPAVDDAARRGLWAAIMTSYSPIPSTTAFDSLISAGETGLIRDASLVREIQGYRLSVNGANVSQLYSYRPMLNNARAVGESLGLAAFGDIDEATLLKLVAETPQLAATIESQLGWIVIYLTQIDAVDQRAAALLKRLEAASAE